MECKILLFGLFLFLCLDLATAGTIRPGKQSFRQPKNIELDRYFNKYLQYDEIQTFIKKLRQRYPTKIKAKLIGTSSEGRKIKLYSITNNNTNCNYRRRGRRQLTITVPDTPEDGWRIPTANKSHNFIHFQANEGPKTEKRQRKPVIFIDGGAHSREWVSPASVLFLMARLAEAPHLTRDVEWKVIPLVNPDGYIYSWKKDRFWRKTLSKNPNSTCSGADINRNFDYKWGEVDTSTNPCAENYGGLRRHSEPETMAIINSLTRVKRRTEAYISVHNWGQDILYPYSYTKEKRPANEEELRTVGQGMVDAIFKSQGVPYKTGMSSVMLYPASGTALDWAYEVLKIPLSYLFELRDDGKEGFRLQEKYVKETGEDLFLAMEDLAKQIQKKYEKIC